MRKQMSLHRRLNETLSKMDAEIDNTKIEKWLDQMNNNVNKHLRFIGRLKKNRYPTETITELSWWLFKLSPQITHAKHIISRKFKELEDTRSAYLKEVESSKQLLDTIEGLIKQRQELLNCLASYNPEIWGIHAKEPDKS